VDPTLPRYGTDFMPLRCVFLIFHLRSRIAGRIFSALGRRGINIIAIAQGSSECNVSLVVEAGLMCEAVEALHSEFGLERRASRFESVESESVLERRASRFESVESESVLASV
jgi:hypothetical protein